jgi:tetrahydromethanopterin S-methyltransferase subunit G
MVMKQKTLIPGVYIERQEINKMPSLEEINSELKELYAELYKSVNSGIRTVSYDYI